MGQINRGRNLHAIEVKYYGPTNLRGSRVKLVSQRFSGQDSRSVKHTDAVTLPYDYKYSNTLDLACAWLAEHGYTVAASAELPSSYVVLVEEFIELKDHRFENSCAFLKDAK